MDSRMKYIIQGDLRAQLGKSCEMEKMMSKKLKLIMPRIAIKISLYSLVSCYYDS